MAEMKIEPAEGLWVVRALGAVLGESRRALRMTEGTYAPTIYFPRDSLAMVLFSKSDKTSVCSHKGDASYYTIHGTSGILENAAWSYENPTPGAKAIAGHLAFHTDRVTVERI